MMKQPFSDKVFWWALSLFIAAMVARGIFFFASGEKAKLEAIEAWEPHATATAWAEFGEYMESIWDREVRMDRMTQEERDKLFWSPETRRK